MFKLVKQLKGRWFPRGVYYAWDPLLKAGGNKYYVGKEKNKIIVMKSFFPLLGDKSRKIL